MASGAKGRRFDSCIARHMRFGELWGFAIAPFFVRGGGIQYKFLPRGPLFTTEKVMNYSIKSVNLFYKGNSAEATGLAREIALWLERRGIVARVVFSGQGLPPGEEHTADPAADLTIALGGDGTILGVARALLEHDTPILGINLGTVGMLAPVSPKHWEDALARVLAGEMLIEPRLALNCSVLRRETLIHEGVALNDVTVNRGALARLVTLSIFMDGMPLGELRTDVVLVSTPTGSSGYCLSVGGPVVSPELDCLIMAPICPFLTIMPPMIFTGDKQIEIVVSYMPTNSEAYLTCDGQEGLALETGDRVIIGAAARKVLLAHLPETSFYSQLKDRGIL